jgi:hypothetical protein
MIKLPTQPFEHSEFLTSLASECDHVVAYSNLDAPVLAILKGSPNVLRSKVNETSNEWLNGPAIHDKTAIIPLDVSSIGTFHTDFLFTAVSNSYREANKILDNCDNIGKFIAFQHYVPFWRQGSDGLPGLSNAFAEFQSKRPGWKPIYKSSHNWGVVVFSNIASRFDDSIKWNPKSYTQADLERETAERKLESINAYHRHWLALHRYPIDVAEWHHETAYEWYSKWCDEIPSTVCTCKKNWLALTERFPPDLTSRRSFFWWTIDRHNDVNREKGKPIFASIEAIEVYRP